MHIENQRNLRREQDGVKEDFAFGASWGSDDTIIFSRQNFGLWSVPAAGGTSHAMDDDVSIILVGEIKLNSLVGPVHIANQDNETLFDHGVDAPLDVGLRRDSRREPAMKTFLVPAFNALASLVASLPKGAGCRLAAREQTLLAV